jgi:Tol biopolymer transport system component
VGNNGKVAFESSRDGTGFRVFTINLDGTAIQQITSARDLKDPTDQQDRYPVISHDGTKVAFLRRTDPSLGFDIYTVKADGTCAR